MAVLVPIIGKKFPDITGWYGVVVSERVLSYPSHFLLIIENKFNLRFSLEKWEKVPFIAF